MCQAGLISNNIVKLSRRSFNQRLDIVSSNSYNVDRLVRLNKELDSFYELLYSQWSTVTEADYNIFGEQLNIMLRTIKDLLATCRKLSKKMSFGDEVAKLDMNYSALSEVNSDIINFRIKMPKDEEIKGLFKRASIVSKNLMS